MLFSVHESFREELAEIRKMLDSEIRFKTARFDEMIDIHFDELDRNACALIVLTFNHAFGGKTKPAVGLAKIIQYVYLADQVHRTMKDDPDLPEPKRQFPVLVGDFLYGKFFLELCKEKLLHFLAPLAKVIGLMNEGAILRWMMSQDKNLVQEKQHILTMERASLTGLAAKLGADLAGCREKDLELCEELGCQLGLAWAAHDESTEPDLIRNSISKAREILREWPRNGPHRIHELIDYMELHLA